MSVDEAKQNVDKASTTVENAKNAKKDAETVSEQLRVKNVQVGNLAREKAELEQTKVEKETSPSNECSRSC